MIVTIRYVGSGESGITLNNEYKILGYNGMKAIILNDSRVPYQTIQSINETNHWVVVSVVHCGCVVAYSE